MVDEVEFAGVMLGKDAGRSERTCQAAKPEASLAAQAPKKPE
jgi:hypothetical protein